MFTRYWLFIALIGTLTNSVLISPALARGSAGAESLAIEATCNKSLRAALMYSPIGFDPAATDDAPSITINDHLFDPLLTYDYLAPKPLLIPNTIEALPSLSADRKTYTFTLKRGIYFAPDKVFTAPRELIAEDYVYSLQRIFDPIVKSPMLGSLDGKIEGIDAKRNLAKTNNRWDYDSPVNGLKALDRYTLKITLITPEPNFLYHLAWSLTGAVAREVVEHYQKDIRAHPVGTGPYMLRSWDRSTKVVLVKNPLFRQMEFNGSPDPTDSVLVAMLAKHKGQKLPRIDCVEYAVIEEDQPRWLSFNQGYFDYIFPVPPDFIKTALIDGKLSRGLDRQGVVMQQKIVAITSFTYFNMNDAHIGGYTPERVALRRALSLAYNIKDEISILRGGQAMVAQSPVSPGVAGYDVNFRSPAVDFDPVRAKALLDLFGYIDRDGDGWREGPHGEPLSIEFGSFANQTGRVIDELWKRSLDRIGVRSRFRPLATAELVKLARTGKLQAATIRWGSPQPDGEGFLLLLYGKNAGNPNMAYFAQPDYDRLYEQAKSMADSPERTKLYNEMNRLVAAYAPWRLGSHPVWTALNHPWLIAFNAKSARNSYTHFLDIDNNIKNQRTLK